MLQSSQTVDGKDQLTSQLALHPICSVHHQVGQLALPVGMLQKGDQSVNVLAADGDELQIGDSRKNGDNLLDGGSRLTEGEQSFDIVGEQVHLKVGIVSDIPLEGTQNGAQGVRFENYRFQMGEYGQLALPFGMLQKGNQVVNSITADGHELQIGDGGKDVDNLMDGGSVKTIYLVAVNQQAVPLAETSDHR
ncbi:hypothetical protein TYRP_015550, partial [Tyrophagus putrescentiae]